MACLSSKVSMPVSKCLNLILYVYSTHKRKLTSLSGGLVGTNIRPQAYPNSSSIY